MRRFLFICGALLLAGLCSLALLEAYAVGVRRLYLPIPRGAARIAAVRNFFVGANIVRLERIIASDSDAQANEAFETTWEDTGVLLSKAMFQSVDMYGAQKYRYKPGLKKLGLWARYGRRQAVEWETEDTPGIREALKELDVNRVTASYDQVGFRHVDPDLEVDCEARALFLGDSFTDGMWVNDAETFVSRFGRLAADRSNFHLCPSNAGVNGYGSMEEAYVLEYQFEDAGRPALVFVIYFANDVDACYECVVEGTIPDVAAEWEASMSYVRRMAQFSRAHSATLVVAAIPTAEQLDRPATRSNYQDVLKQYCANEGLPFVDLLDALRAVRSEGLYWEWDPHLTPRGHEAVAEILYEETRPLVESLRTKTE